MSSGHCDISVLWTSNLQNPHSSRDVLFKSDIQRLPPVGDCSGGESHPLGQEGGREVDSCSFVGIRKKEVVEGMETEREPERS